MFKVVFEFTLRYYFIRSEDEGGHILTGVSVSLGVLLPVDNGRPAALIPTPLHCRVVSERKDAAAACEGRFCFWEFEA